MVKAIFPGWVPRSGSSPESAASAERDCRGALGYRLFRVFRRFLRPREVAYDLVAE